MMKRINAYDCLFGRDKTQEIEADNQTALILNREEIFMIMWTTKRNYLRNNETDEIEIKYLNL